MNQKLKRYGLESDYIQGICDMEVSADGEFVKFSDIQPLIEALKFYERGDNMKESGCATFVGRCDQDADHGDIARQALKSIGEV